MNQLNYQHNDVGSCENRRVVAARSIEFYENRRVVAARSIEFYENRRVVAARSIEFYENRRVLAHTNQSSLTRSNRYNS